MSPHRRAGGRPPLRQVSGGGEGGGCAAPRLSAAGSRGATALLPAGRPVVATPAPQPLCLFPLAEVFLLEETRSAAPVDFLQELPSYQSALRRRAAAGGTQERRAVPRGSAGLRAAEARGPEQEGGELADRPAREWPLSMAEKRRLRLIFTRCFFPLFQKTKKQQNPELVVNTT